MTKNLLLMILFIFPIFSMYAGDNGNWSFEQYNSSGVLQVGVTVVQGLNVSVTQTLSFGKIVPPPPTYSSNGTVSAGSIGGSGAPNSGVTSSGGVEILEAGHMGEISIYYPGYSSENRVLLKSNPPTVLINEEDSSATMALSETYLWGPEDSLPNLGYYKDRLYAGSASSDDYTHLVFSDDEITLYAMGTLSVAPKQKPGRSSANWTITVAYY